MAQPLIPGLADQAQLQSTPSGAAPDQRPQAPQDPVNIQQLHPVAQPLDNYYRPPQAMSQDPNLQRIAQSLSAFQPELQSYSQAQTQLQQVQGGNALAPYQGASPADLSTALKGNPQLQGIAAQRLGLTMLGNKTAETTASEMTQAYNEGTWRANGQSFEDFANSYYQRDLKANGGSPFFANGYNETFNNVKKGLLANETKFTMENAASQRNDLLGTTFSNAIDSSLHRANETGQPTDTASLMQGITSTMATVKGISGMSRPEQAQALLSGIGKQADTLMTDPNWEAKGTALMNLLKQDRGDGAGSLYDTEATGAQSAKLYEHIQQTMDQKFGQTTTAVADIKTKAFNGDPTYRDDLNTLAAQHPFLDKARLSEGMDWTFQQATIRSQNKNAYNDGLMVYNGQKANAVNSAQANLEAGQPVTNDVTVNKPKANGDYEDETIKSDQLQKQAVNQKQAQIDAQFPNAASDPNQAQAKFQAEMNFYGKAGIPNEQWKSSLNNGYLGAGTALAAGHPPSQATQQGFQTYLQIEAQNQPMLSKVATGDTLKFYQAAATYMHSGYSQNDALATAARTVQDGSINTTLKKDPKNPTANEDQDASYSLSRASQSNWNPINSNFHNGIPDLSGAANVSEVTDQVKRMAALYQRNGSLSYQDALDHAAKSVASQYSLVGNQAVYTGDHAVPPDFGAQASKFMDNWWATNGANEEKLGYNRDMLRIRPAGSGAGWYMAFPDGSTPPWSSGAHFGLGDLNVVKQQMDQAAATSAKAKLDQNLNKGPSVMDRLFTNPRTYPTPSLVPGMQGN